MRQSKNTMLKFLKIPKEISWYAGASILSLLFAFIGMSFVSRYLGPTNLGLYSFAINYVGVFLSTVSGLELYYTWHLAKSTEKIKDLKSFAIHKFHILITLTVISIGLAFIILPADVAILCMVLSFPLILHSFTVFSIFANTQGNAKVYASSQVVSAIILLSARLLLVSFHADLKYFVLVSAFDLLITAILITVFYVKDKELVKEFKHAVSPKFLDTVKLLYTIRFSILAFISWQLILRADQLILATFANAYTLGIYSAAAKIAEVPNFIAGILYIYTIPKFGNTATETEGVAVSFFTQYKKILYAYVGVGLFITAGIVIGAPYAVKIIYGSQYLESIAILRVYALSITPMFLLYFFFSLYSSVGRYKMQTAVFASGFILNIFVIKTGFAYFGIRGVALASAITYTLLVLAFSYFYNRKKVL